MTTTRFTMALFVVLCMCLNAHAQFDDTYEVEEWTLDDEEVTPKPQHSGAPQGGARAGHRHARHETAGGHAVLCRSWREHEVFLGNK